MFLEVLPVLCVFASFVFGHLYEVTIDSFEPDPEIGDTYISISTVRVTRKDRNSFSIQGNFETHHNWGNENLGIVEVRGKNGKGPTLVSVMNQFCDIYNSDLAFVKTAIEASNLPPQGTCPMPKGNYTIYGFELQEKDLPMMIPKDQYEVSARLMNPDGVAMVGYKIKLTVS
ncbi:uncharacterized protein LOC120416187 [Culex pipiens pallens]|uniref:uncharacterized protein LOC120416187 n=1 Tax=Culex pipiens pallens TaxID=42434 RepID=UPI0019533E5F|nr:uncharacterized protein LOC120416187 [Culex pipiens pallens]